MTPQCSKRSKIMEDNKIEFTLPDGKKVRLDLAKAKELNLIEEIREDIKDINSGDVIIIHNRKCYIQYSGVFKYIVAEGVSAVKTLEHFEKSDLILYLNKHKATKTGKNIGESIAKLLNKID